MPVESASAISLPVASATVLARRQFVAMDNTGMLVSPPEGGGGDQEGIVVGVTAHASANGDTSVVPVARLDGARLEVIVGAEAITAGASISTDSSGRAKPADANTDALLGVATHAVPGNKAGAILTFISAIGARAATA